MLHIICYRLHGPVKKYDDLYKAIKGISGTYWHNTTSSWIVKSSSTAKQVFDYLSQYIDKDDELAVFELEGSWNGQLRPDDLAWIDKQVGLIKD